MRRLLALVLVLLPAGLWQCRVLRHAVQPWTMGDTVTVQADLGYRGGSRHARHHLDLFLPGRAGAPHAFVLFIHGGFWKNQDRRYYRPLTGLYWNIGYSLATEGYATAVLSYRLYPEVRIDGEAEDIAAAVDWARAKMRALGIRDDCFYIMGHSAGGHLAAVVGLESGTEQTAGIIALSPILDILQMHASPPPEFDRDATEAVFGPDPDTWQRYSPARHWHAGAPPLLLIYGADDLAFIRNQIGQFDRLARGSAWPVTVSELPGLDHADMVLQFDAAESPVREQVLEFLRNSRTGQTTP